MAKTAPSKSKMTPAKSKMTPWKTGIAQAMSISTPAMTVSTQWADSALHTKRAISVLYRGKMTLHGRAEMNCAREIHHILELKENWTRASRWISEVDKGLWSSAKMSLLQKQNPLVRTQDNRKNWWVFDLLTSVYWFCTNFLLILYGTSNSFRCWSPWRRGLHERSVSCSGLV